MSALVIFPCSEHVTVSPLIPRKRWKDKLASCQYARKSKTRALLEPPWRPWIDIHATPDFRSWFILTFDPFPFSRTVILRPTDCSEAFPDLQRRWDLVQRPLGRTALAVTNRFLKKLEIIEIKRKD